MDNRYNHPGSYIHTDNLKFLNYHWKNHQSVSRPFEHATIVLLHSCKHSLSMGSLSQSCVQSMKSASHWNKHLSPKFWSLKIAITGVKEFWCYRTWSMKIIAVWNLAETPGMNETYGQSFEPKTRIEVTKI